MMRSGALILCLSILLQACAGTQLSQDPQNRKKAAQYNAQLGINYMVQQNDLEQARLKLEKALEQDDDNALANLGYAQLQARVGESSVAEKHFERAIELEPLKGDHRNAYGVFLCQQDKLDAALQEFDLAVENKYYQTSEIALDNAGLCLLENSRLNEAELYFVEAIKNNSRYAPSLLNLADLNLRRNKLDLANAYYDRASRLSRSSANSLWIGYQIKRQRGDTGPAEKLASDLLRTYPNSRQAGELLKLTAND